MNAIRPKKIPVRIRYNNNGLQSVEPIPPIRLPEPYYGIMIITDETVIFENDVYTRGYIFYDQEIARYN